MHVSFVRLVAVAVACALSVTVAYAAIPASNGTIRGCYSRSSGALRVIDSTASGCAKGENSLDWSQIGPAGLTWRGSWLAGITYAPNDAVVYQGSSYRTLNTTVGEAPDTPGSLNWTLLAQKGQKGDKGDPGEPGASGVPGASGAPATISSAEVAQGGSIGIPDDGYPRDVVQLVLGAGSWVVVGKAVLHDAEDDRGFVFLLQDGCQLAAGGTIVDAARVTLHDSNDGRGAVDFPLAMTGIVTGPATVKLQCQAQPDADGVEVSQAHLVALRIAQ